MNNLNIRRVTLKDLYDLQKIGRQTFSETFAPFNKMEDMDKYLNEEFATDKLRDELSSPDTEFYFSTIENEIIGYLKVNFGESQTEIKKANSLEIERIYLLNEFHGKNVGQQLYEKAVEIGRLKDVDYIWLGVWEENPRAIRFYEKNGFIKFDKHTFKLGNDEQTDIMMKKVLKS